MNSQIVIQYRIVSPYASSEFLPKPQTEGAAGADLYACLPEPLLIQPQQRVRIPTGIAIEMPDNNCVGLIFARSGHAWRYGLGLPNGVGVIDSDYRGELQVLLQNFGDQPVSIQSGDRVAQIVFLPIFHAHWVLSASLSPTERGKGGFGSTGES
ncbi:dUTP diphosphatase [Alicyclobacillus tolerans]|uniref:dUTP diphosphatase n=1 Tax=Alicyclobacillus TaxID=29330 RepID=UPI001932F427|nr:dUTP diphosphatase [Alicyclobacillus sp. TC]QRF23677.1 dUTP diphosphatase [Alicyclobacillus sp. TC]